MTSAAGRRPAAPAPNLSGVNERSDVVVRTLADVLAGRDRAPVWRSAATRRLAVVSGWAGFALIAFAALAALVVAGHARTSGSQPSVPHAPGLFGWLAVGLAVAAALPVAPRYGLLAWRIAFLGVLVTPLIPGQTDADGGYYAILAVTFAVAGVRYGPRYAWCMWVLSLIPVWLWTGPDWVYPAVNTGWLALLAAATHAVSYWRRDRRALAAQKALAEEQRERAERQRERNAVLEERARIAREMHDVVAHHMSMIAVQAETAPYRLAGSGSGSGEPGDTAAAGLPQPVAAEFAALSEAARAALTEMRRLLGVLRSDNARPASASIAPSASASASAATPAASLSDNSKKMGQEGTAGYAELAPQPRLNDIPGLVETARRAGAQVTLSLPEAADRPVPAAVGLAAYRIVQESLSNAARHAPGARISVTVEAAAGRVRVSVLNGPPSHATPPVSPNGTGHGLVGMRERAELLGGTLDAGPVPDGGFAVRATLLAGDTSGLAGERDGAPEASGDRA
jgi:signal transduction histidine kinase